MTTPDPLASMSPEELIAVIERGLDADEQRARRAAAQWDDEHVRYEWEDLPDNVFAHARWHDPSRVLADVESKRKLVERYRRAHENRRAHPDDLASSGALLALHGVMTDLARPYLDQDTP